MNTWVTADLHFFHERIIDLCPATRKYNDILHMHESMVSVWNLSVHQDDLVYILGDCSFANGKITADFFSKLNGRKILVSGNHDSDLLKCPEFIDCFESIHTILEVDHAGTFIVMCHFPMVSWNKSHFGSIHFHGHTHGHYESEFRSLDVGVDATGYVVSNLNEMVNQASKKPFHANHPRKPR